MNYFAFSFSGELTGWPALLVIGLLFYIFIYLPIKFVFSLLAKIKQKNDRLRNLKQRTIVAEYETPTGLTPAEIGFLHDSKLNIAEVYATIIYLHKQGLIMLVETGGRQIIESTRPAPPTLKPFEKYVLAYASQHTQEAVTIGLLKRAKLEGDLVINKQLQDAGYLLTRREQIKRSLFRLGLIWLSLIILTTVLTRPNTSEGIQALIFFMVFLAPVYFVTSVFLYFTIQKIAGEPWLLSPEIKNIWPDIEGYSQYIKQVELDNLQFESQEMQGQIRNKSLPYAIALGYNTGWLDKVKN